MSLFLSYFERVSLNSQVHSVFSTNWNSYTSYEFGTTFLPQSNIQSSGQLRAYDAAELINSISFDKLFAISLESLLANREIMQGLKSF